MSKRQEKIAAERLDQQRFIATRRMQQLSILKNNYEIGEKLFEDNKESLSAEEIEQIEAMRTDQKAALKRLEDELQTLVDELDEAHQKFKA